MVSNVISLFPKKSIEESESFEREEIVKLKVAFNTGRKEFHSLSPQLKYELYDTAASLAEKLLVINLEMAMKLRKINEEIEE
ncbi:hypothetical protein D3C71_1904150 [compost metagenome]